MRRNRSMAHAAQKGFTLLELLVAFALMSLLVLGLAGAMSTVSSTSQRVESRLDLADQQRVHSGFLRAVLGNISAVKRQGGTFKPNQSQFVFSGAGDSIEWLGYLPPGAGAAGRQHMRLDVGPLADGSAGLVLHFMPWQGPEVDPNWGQAQTYVLERDVQGFVLSYRDAGRGDWLPAWTEPRYLPAAISVRVATRQGGWPLLAVAVHSPLLTNPGAESEIGFGSRY
ncbi:prepilin-type N-terminal cleavage/methylation domain-containing protein [Delftia acidovorans]|jgi:general secretion pathway protein J|uniref:prepilin-type N-terminal cleavage/methylation domain-containing protein n=2 Tax=Delftia acidovorans TaxID=80866 RepID=UPI0028B09B56|nr:prepilin-type N-terminal cleavage/methylation domain-containing protein [Delftia acidovorans]